MSPREPRSVRRRLLALREALAELERPAAGDERALLADPVLRAAVERWLQVAIEACIDLAMNEIARHAWTPPATARAAFATLAAHGRIEPDLAEKLAQAAGLRNLLVHDYAAVDLAILARVVREDVQWLGAFAALAASRAVPAG